MIQAKVFIGGYATEVQDALNKWLEEQREIEVSHVTQSQSGGQDDFQFAITVFYKTKDS